MGQKIHAKKAETFGDDPQVKNIIAFNRPKNDGQMNGCTSNVISGLFRLRTLGQILISQGGRSAPLLL